MTEPSKTEVCSNCRMPRQAPGSGSITQWIAVCRCHTIIENTDLPLIEVCARCGKRVEAGRSGSLTQWIFRSDICSCQTPELIRTTASPAVAAGVPPGSALPEIEEYMEELDLSPEHFPLERYGPVAKLGQGASGSVYMCKDRLLKKRVAVKVLHNLSPEKLVAFQREAKAISKLSNPGIVKILDFGASAGSSPYMVLECLDGISLDQYLRQFGRLDQSTAARVFYKVCDALAYAHKNDIYHRDLKPSNILVSIAGAQIESVCLIDFGVAQVKNENQEPTVIRGNEVTGTPAYMSPDQILNEPFDSRSEIYSLGCVMFESLIGEPPFYGDTALDTMTMHLNNEPRTLAEAAMALEAEGWHQALERIIAKCLEKEPAKRFQNFAELNEALKTFRSQLGCAVEEELEKPRKNSRVIIGAAVFVGAVVLIGGQQFLSKRNEPKVSPDAEHKRLQKPFKDVWRVSRVKPDKVSSLSTGGSADESQANDDDDRGIDTLRAQPANRSKPDNLSGRQDNFRDYNGGAVPPTLELSYLPIDGVTLVDGDLALLKGRNVEVLSVINQRGLKDAAFQYLKVLPIRRLLASYTEITDEALRHIGQLKELESLDIDGCQGVTSDGLKYICDLPNLRSLHLKHIRKLDDRVAPYLSKMKKLERVLLESTRVGDETLKAIENLPIGEIRLGDCNNVTDRGLESLARLRDTHVIDVGSKHVTHEGFARLANRFDNIIRVRLDGCTRIGDRTAALVARRYPHLVELQLSGSCITAAGIKEVAKLAELRELRLASLDLKDEDLLPLLKMPRLKILDLTDDRLITDKTAKAFAKMPSLERILLHASGVTTEGIQFLKQHSKVEAHGFFTDIGRDKDTAVIFQEIGD